MSKRTESPMNTEDVIWEFRQPGALMEGHFILTCGLHSPRYVQKTLLFMDPQRTERVCKALAKKIEDKFGKVDVVVSPAVGAIIPGYETARHLNAKIVFVERENGQFALRR